MATRRPPTPTTKPTATGPLRPPHELLAGACIELWGSGWRTPTGAWHTARARWLADHDIPVTDHAAARAAGLGCGGLRCRSWSFDALTPDARAAKLAALGLPPGWTPTDSQTAAEHWRRRDPTG